MKPDLGSSTLRVVPVAPPDRPIRLAIFGAGKAARFHLDALDRIPGTSIVGVCSRSGTTAEALVAGRPGAIATADPAVLVDPERVDAAVVAVSPDHAEPITLALLAAGIPVLAEKPAALSSAAVEVLADAARATDTLAVVAVNRRYYSLVQDALAVVRQRGPVRGVVVEGHENTDDLRREGAIDDASARRWLVQNSVHYVDLLRMVGGEVEEVVGLRASARSAGFDHLSASIRFAGGTVGTYLAHWNSEAPPMLRIYGEHVQSEVRLLPPEAGFAQFAFKRRIRLAIDPVDEVAKAGVLEQDLAFLRAVAAGRSSVPFPASSMSDHAATLRLVEAIGGP